MRAVILSLAVVPVFCALAVSAHARYADGPNVYAYVQQTPTAYIDPSGHQGEQQGTYKYCSVWVIHNANWSDQSLHRPGCIHGNPYGSFERQLAGRSPSWLGEDQAAELLKDVGIRPNTVDDLRTYPRGLHYALSGVAKLAYRDVITAEPDPTCPKADCTKQTRRGDHEARIKLTFAVYTYGEVTRMETPRGYRSIYKKPQTLEGKPFPTGSAQALKFETKESKSVYALWYQPTCLTKDDRLPEGFSVDNCALEPNWAGTWR